MVLVKFFSWQWLKPEITINIFVSYTLFSSHVWGIRVNSSDSSQMWRIRANLATNIERICHRFVSFTFEMHTPTRTKTEKFTYWSSEERRFTNFVQTRTSYLLTLLFNLDYNLTVNRTEVEQNGKGLKTTQTEESRNEQHKSLAEQNRIKLKWREEQNSICFKWNLTRIE